MSLTTIFKKNGEQAGTTATPSVIRYAPIRPDIVKFVHANLAKNQRQPYGRFRKAGHQHSAESWGTGRAVARVPRISGSGTSRNGQGAFANMTRGGRMFAPLKIWRRWHRIVNVSQKRFAICSAIAASSVPALVMARGHNIDKVPEIPLVVADDAEQIKKTKEAVSILCALHANNDVKRSAESRKIRPGAGKMRNRRFIQKKGVLVIYDKNEGLSRAMRNISGVSLQNVNRLNIKELAPGGRIGRFIVWTEGAYKKLDALYGTRNRDAQLKRGYRHPMSEMKTTDLHRIIASDEVQSALKPSKQYKPIVPKLRRKLLLTRKHRTQTVLNNGARKYRKEKLAKLRAAKKNKKPESDKKKKEKKPKTGYRAEAMLEGLPLKARAKVAKKATEQKAKKQ